MLLFPLVFNILSNENIDQNQVYFFECVEVIYNLQFQYLIKFEMIILFKHFFLELKLCRSILRTNSRRTEFETSLRILYSVSVTLNNIMLCCFYVSA